MNTIPFTGVYPKEPLLSFIGNGVVMEEKLDYIPLFPSLTGKHWKSINPTFPYGIIGHWGQYNPVSSPLPVKENKLFPQGTYSNDCTNIGL